MGKEHTPSEVLSATGSEFLLTDLDVALTFMDAAETTESKEHAQRDHQNARSAYDTVLRLLPKLQLDVAQRNEVDKKLAALKARLTAAGQEF
ncbi:MAG: hypothetical protein JO108_00675 [Acidobacteriaceae bacterium]|nr:hypothetical protein [Acidobacteriaceae bacterium]